MNTDSQNKPRAKVPGQARSSFPKLLFAGSILVLVVAIFLSYPFHLGSYSREVEEKSTSAKASPITHECSLPIARYDISTGQAACYPSSGGIWMAELDSLELQYLGINRFESSERSWSQVEEDHFCRQLRPFGGSWYTQSADDLWIGERCTELRELMPAFSIRRCIGFPENGGIWVLAIEEDERFPPGMATVRNALTMEERCMALERLGAVFCADLTGCPAFQDLSKRPNQLAEEKESDWGPECGGAL